MDWWVKPNHLFWPGMDAAQAGWRTEFVADDRRTWSLVLRAPQGGRALTAHWHYDSSELTVEEALPGAVHASVASSLARRVGPQALSEAQRAALALIVDGSIAACDRYATGIEVRQLLRPMLPDEAKRVLTSLVPRFASRSIRPTTELYRPTLPGLLAWNASEVEVVIVAVLRCLRERLHSDPRSEVYTLNHVRVESPGPLVGAVIDAAELHNGWSPAEWRVPNDVEDLASLETAQDFWAYVRAGRGVSRPWSTAPYALAEDEDLGTGNVEGVDTANERSRLSDLIDPPGLRAIRETQERLRDLIDPPGLRAFRETQERLRDLIDPPGLRALREMQERLRDLIDPPGLRALRETQERLRDMFDPPALRTMRGLQQQYADVLNPPWLVVIRRQYAENAERYEHLFAAHAPLVPDQTFTNLMTSWSAGSRIIEQTADSVGLTALAGHAQSLVRVLDALQPTMPRFDALVGGGTEAGRSRAGLLFGLMSVAGEATSKLFDSNESAGLVLAASDEVARAVALDAMATAEDVSDVAEQELALPASDAVLAATEEFSRRLAAMLRGAREALRRRGPDYQRHVGTSLRELLGQLLRELAPEPSVRGWSQFDPKRHLSDRGRITRTARLEYVSSTGRGGFLGSILTLSTKHLVLVMDELNALTHSDDDEIQHRQLFLLFHRVEYVVSGLLLERLDREA